MDLSQQELPLTTYFTKGNKEARPRAVQHKTARPAEESHSAPRSPKRRRTKHSSHAGSAKPMLQLPTPATSARKRMRGGRLRDLPASSVESNMTPSSEKHLAQPSSAPTPSKPHRLCADGAVAKANLGTPFNGRGRATEPIGLVFSPGRRLPNSAETCIVTPRTLSRRAPKSVHGINDHSPLAGSSRRSPPKPSQASSGSSYTPVHTGYLDPFHTYERDTRTLLSREDISPPLKQPLIQRETSYGQASSDPLIPAIPVPSSQSQYLLHLDATPKHKRYSRRIEHVVSSQTQEEVELMLSTSCNPCAATISSSVVHFPAKYTPCRNAQVPGVSSRRERHHDYALSSTSVGSPVNSPPNSSRFSVKSKESNEVPPKLSSPSGGNTLTPSHSPSSKGKGKTVQSLAHHGSIENVPSEYIEDSLTEPESELDIFLVPPRVSAPKDACTPIRCGPAQGNLPSMEDDSATEAESDTEFRNCLAEIGRKPSIYRSKVSKEDALPPPVISPLVSPARPRVVTGPSSMKLTQFSTQEGAGLSVPGSCLPSAPVLEQIQARSGSLPSIVRDFACMFPGDESYPADFPESLRV